MSAFGRYMLVVRFVRRNLVSALGVSDEVISYFPYLAQAPNVVDDAHFQFCTVRALHVLILHFT